MTGENFDGLFLVFERSQRNVLHVVDLRALSVDDKQEEEDRLETAGWQWFGRFNFDRSQI